MSVSFAAMQYFIRLVYIQYMLIVVLLFATVGLVISESIRKALLLRDVVYLIKKTANRAQD